MRADIAPGGQFPDYELPDHTGRLRRVSEIADGQPMIVVLSRGNFCPKDQVQHRLLAEFQQELDVAYTKIVTISTDTPAQSWTFRGTVRAEWPFLSDQDRHVRDDLEIAEYTDAKNNPLIPHVIVLDSGLVVHKVYNGYWYWGRPSLEDLRRDLREIFEKRPDWDITTPGLREQWDAGDRTSFFPYEPAAQRVPVGAVTG
jgi:peroxiredoxin